MEEPPGKRNPAASLTDDILVKILSYFPVRDVCRFKCVCQSWRDLISHPYYRRMLLQTLTGFYYIDGDDFRVFANVTGKGGKGTPFPLSFLPVSSSYLILEDSCDGLLLCSWSKRDNTGGWYYVVCNPATEKWVMLPDGMEDIPDDTSVHAPRLCFDPTVSRHFHIIAHVADENSETIGLKIYSSKTGSWSFVENGWGDYVMVWDDGPRSVFLNGFLHSLTVAVGIVAVDTGEKMEDNSGTTNLLWL